MTKRKFDLGRAFMRKQVLLSKELQIPLEFTDHSTTIGDASEANWVRMFRSFLPGRYEVGPIFALDAMGEQSEQIDLAIYDRQYSPLWFTVGDDRFVPVESIYAAFEVKQIIHAAHLEYAAKKVESVRKLHRTSATIVDIHGPQRPVDPADRPILGGILGLRSGWKDGLTGATGQAKVLSHKGLRHLDLGLALVDRAFDHVPENQKHYPVPAGLSYSQPNTQLIFFMIHLFRRLQATGTALAVDLAVYEKALDEIDPAEAGAVATGD
jgi:hypothetical protein